MRYLNQIASRQKSGKESKTELLFELKEAFDEAIERRDGPLPELMQTLHNLLRFCINTGSIVPFLRDEPNIIQQALIFSEKNKIKKLASILRDALDGKPQSKISFSGTLSDGVRTSLEIEAQENCRFDGKYWDSTDIAISMTRGDFERALLQEILDECATLNLQEPLSCRKKIEENLKKHKSPGREEVQAAISWEAAKEKKLSKFGGLPEVRQGFVWPQWKGASLSFLAQLDLSELPSVPPALEGLPQTGILYFFYDKEQTTWGFDPEDRGSWCVLYDHDTVDLQEAVCPADLSDDEIYIELPVIPCVVESFRGAEVAYHQMGGFPNAIQNEDMEEECQLVSNGINVGAAIPKEDEARTSLLLSAKEDWHLLFQLDSEDAAGMMWGDCGILYFWIRTQDLSRHDFSNVWMILQCC